VGVDVAPPGDDLAMQVGNAVHDRHLLSPRTTLAHSRVLARAFGVARLEAAATRAIEIGARLWIGPFHCRPISWSGMPCTSQHVLGRPGQVFGIISIGD